MENNKKEPETIETEKQALSDEELEDVSGGIIYFMKEKPKPEIKAGIH